MSLLLRVAERVLNRPLLVHPDKVPLILGVLQGRIPVDVGDLGTADLAQLPEAARAAITGPAPEASRFEGEWGVRDSATGQTRTKVYPVTVDGIANIAVVGSLVNRGAWLGAYSGRTSYEGLQHQIRAAASDPDVRGIILDIHSPGGEAVGAFETAAIVQEAAREKPVTAVVNGMAASAAYAIASAASRIVITSTGVAGSIGVVLVHADYSRALDKAGITPTLIFAGAHKVDGNPFEPLPDVVRADLQAEVERFYDLFVETVAAGRRATSPAAIRATEARTFIGRDAVERGLADEVGSFASALADLRRSARSITGGTRMSKQAAPAAEQDVPGPMGQAPDRATNAEALAAARQEGHAAGRAEGIQAGREAAQARIAGILDHADASGREALARHLAFRTDMSVEAAVAALAATPKAAAPDANPLAALAAAAPAVVLGAPPVPQNAASGLAAALDAEIARNRR